MIAPIRERARRQAREQAPGGAVAPGPGRVDTWVGIT